MARRKNPASTTQLPDRQAANGYHLMRGAIDHISGKHGAMYAGAKFPVRARVNGKVVLKVEIHCEFTVIAYPEKVTMSVYWEDVGADYSAMGLYAQMDTAYQRISWTGPYLRIRGEGDRGGKYVVRIEIGERTD